MIEERMRQLAELAVGFAANVQPGQVLGLTSEVGKQPMVRALAASAYRRGAKFVDPSWHDMHVKRARLEHADADTLDFVPSWYGARLLALQEAGGANISLAGPEAPGLLDDLDPARTGRDQLPWLKETNTLVNERRVNWSVIPVPGIPWAKLVHADLDDGEALERLWEDIVYVCRLDEPDPVAAWRARMKELAAVAERLTEHRFDALHFQGPGTDLKVGLFPSSLWGTAWFTTVDGIRHLANLPTEEVFTCPDPERTEGTVRSTKPLVLIDGTVIRGLTVRFEGGRAVEIDADTGGDVMRAQVSTDEGAARLGEVALVDRLGRIGQVGKVFYSTLLDENAASHIALGSGFDFALEDRDRPRRNRSAIHIDFMIGGDEVEVTGLTGEGERVPVLRGGDWQL